MTPIARNAIVRLADALALLCDDATTAGLLNALQAAEDQPGLTAPTATLCQLLFNRLGDKRPECAAMAAKGSE